MAWKAEERAAYEAKVAESQRITEEGTKALGKALREVLVSNIKCQADSFLRSLFSRASDIELWWFYDFMVTAESDCLYEGLRYSLSHGGTKVLADSMRDEPEEEPGDDEQFNGERTANVIYADAAAEDRSWISETPTAPDYQLLTLDPRSGDMDQILSMSRLEYKRLKLYLAQLRGLEAGAE